MDKIDIEGVARLGEVGLFPGCAIVISLHLNVGSSAQQALPATEQITPAQLGILFHIRHEWWRVAVDLEPLSRITVVQVALERQGVTLVQIPVRAEAGLAHPPAIE